MSAPAVGDSVRSTFKPFGSMQRQVMGPAVFCSLPIKPPVKSFPLFSIKPSVDPLSVPASLSHHVACACAPMVAHRFYVPAFVCHARSLNCPSVAFHYCQCLIS